MRRLLSFLFVLGIVVMAIYWLRGGGPTEPPSFGQLQHEVESGASKVKRAANEKLGLDTDRIRDELARTGRVVRRKAAEVGTKVADATVDARTTAAIKAKLALDSQLSAWDISVDTTAGRVTLAGTVTSPELIQKAMSLALEQDGVDEVISTLQVKADAKPGHHPRAPVATQSKPSATGTAE
jgi:hypothetical protein